MLDVMRNVASSCLQACTVAAKDHIFCCGVEALAAYLPVSGGVSYLQEGKPPTECLHVWTAEMCLWTEWYFVGDLIATDVSRILMMDMNCFCQTLTSNPMTHGLAVQFAKAYLEGLRAEVELSDIWNLESEPEVHDMMANRGMMPELVFNSFGRRKGRQHSAGLHGFPGMTRLRILPDDILALK
mmetsp:Transcript_57596/g.103733  ORF Transcript_57596/g.103733 Transcript_57596/m.103733 type:complete len:184 (+) Transcript_57596:1-552(+)